MRGGLLVLLDNDARRGEDQNDHEGTARQPSDSPRPEGEASLQAEAIGGPHVKHPARKCC